MLSISSRWKTVSSYSGKEWQSKQEFRRLFPRRDDVLTRGGFSVQHRAESTPWVQDGVTMLGRSIVIALCILSSIPTHAQRVNGEATYISFSVPGAQGTYPMSINASTTVTGYYYVSPGVTRGFVRDADGTITTFAIKGGVWTEPESINAGGDITGFYEITAGIPQGFLRHADGTVITFAPSGEVPVGPAQAQPVSINEFGDIAGNYPFPTAASSVFTRSSGGVFHTIRGPVGAAYATVATSMNGSGAVVGYVDDAEVVTGFVAHPDGYWADVVVPFPPEECTNRATIPEAINAEGAIAGFYVHESEYCETESTGGFVLSPEGLLTLFAVPGTLSTSPEPGFPLEERSFTVPHWISLDDSGDIAGSYTDAGGIQHGFVRNPYGTITTFDPPESKQTTSTSINNLGEVAGYYAYHPGSGAPLGFIRVPKS